MRQIEEGIWMDNTGRMMSFSLKYLAPGYFDRLISGEYSYGEGIEELTYSALVEQAGGDTIWGYYDTGFNLRAEKIDSEESFTAFVKKTQVHRFVLVCFYVKEVD